MASCDLSEAERQFGPAVNFLAFGKSHISKALMQVLASHIPKAGLDRIVGPTLVLLTSEREKTSARAVLWKKYRWDKALEWIRSRFADVDDLGDSGEWAVCGTIDIDRLGSAHTVIYVIAKKKEEPIRALVYDSGHFGAIRDVVIEGVITSDPQPVFAKLLGEICDHCTIYARDVGTPVQSTDSFCQTYGVINMLHAIENIVNYGWCERTFNATTYYMSSQPFRRKMLMLKVWNAVLNPKTREQLKAAMVEDLAEFVKSASDPKDQEMAKAFAKTHLEMLETAYTPRTKVIRRIFGAAILEDDPVSIIEHTREYVVKLGALKGPTSLQEREADLLAHGIRDWKTDALTVVRQLFLNMVANDTPLWSVMDKFMTGLNRHSQFRQVLVDAETVTPVVEIDSTCHSELDEVVVSRQHNANDERSAKLSKMIRTKTHVYELDETTPGADVLFRYALAIYANNLVHVEFKGAANLAKRLTNAVKSSPEVQGEIVNLFLQTVAINFGWFVDECLIPDYPELAESFRPRIRITGSDDDVGRGLKHVAIHSRPVRSTLLVRNLKSPTEYMVLESPPLFHTDGYDCKNVAQKFDLDTKSIVYSWTVKRKLVKDGPSWSAFDTVGEGHENAILRAQLKILDKVLDNQSESDTVTFKNTYPLVQDVQAMSDSFEVLLEKVHLYAGSGLID